MSVAEKRRKQSRTAPSKKTHELIDIPKIVGQYPGLLALCLLSSLILGAAYFAAAPRVYESRASLLVETKHSPVFNEQTMEDRPSMEKTIDTHSIVIKSPIILDQAIDEFGLDKLASLKDAENIVTHIQENMSVEIPDQDSSILELTFRGPSPEDCQKVVEAVSSTYQQYLGDSNQGVGTETTELILKAKDDLLKQLTNTEQQYSSFRARAPLMWKDGVAVNIHGERQADLEMKRKELLVEKAMLKAKVASVESAIAAGGPTREAIHYEALVELRLTEDLMDDSGIQRETARGYSYELSREYLTLLTQEKQMAAEYGAGHPELIAIRGRVKAYRKMLANNLKSSTSSALGGQTKDYADVYRRVLIERIASLDRQIKTLDATYAQEQVAANKIQEYLAQDLAYRTGIERTKGLFDAVVTRLEEINIIQDYGGDTIKVIAPAELGEQTWPSIPITGALATLFGMISGLGMALIAHNLEATFRSSDEVRRALGAPILGQIPKLQAGAEMKMDEHAEIDHSICTLHRQGSRHAEAFRAIRSALYFSSSRKNYKVIQVTSPVPGDGKSTMAGNLAVAIAMSGKKVLLIDADCRRPRVNALFGLDNEVGLSSVLQNESQLEDAVFFTSVENLFIMPSGPTPSNPAELLTSPGFGQLLDIVKEDFDLVIVDSPPVLPVTDAVAVAARVDAVMLAIRIRKGVQITAMRAKEILDGVDANVMGIVVNAVDGRYGRSSYGYGYGKYGRYGGYGSYSDGHGYYLEETPSSASNNGIARPKENRKPKANNAEPLRLVSKAE